MELVLRGDIAVQRHGGEAEGAGDEQILASVLWSLGILLVAAAGIALGFQRSKDR
ncbi:MAG TPA: hypothetical protein H9837_14545 [Candidatus Brachybacterium merdigallinarum]|nr:hypothetical protein [Candidatus Brachybacterium merdigallinarum]